MENSNDEIDLGQLVRAIWSGKWLIGALLVTFGMLGFFYAAYAAKTAVRTYVATATVSIERNQSQLAVVNVVVRSLPSEQSSLNTEVQRIKSPQLLRQLVLDEDLTQDPEFNPHWNENNQPSIAGAEPVNVGEPEPREYSNDELISIAVSRLRGRVTATNPKGTLIVQIDVSTGSAEKSTNLANALAQIYINDRVLFKEEQALEAIEFLEARTVELQNELNEAEFAISDLAARIELVTPEALIAKDLEVGELTDRLAALDGIIEQRQALVDMYQGFDLNDATTAEVALFESRALSDLFATIAQNDSDRARFIDLLATETNRARSDLAQSQTQKTTLEKSIADIEEEVANGSRNLLTLRQLQRESEATGEIYGYFLTKLSEAEVQLGTQQSDAQILSPAVGASNVSSSRVMLNATAFGFLGAMLGAGLVILIELNKGSVRTASDLKKLTGKPVLGQIPMPPIKTRNKLLPFLESKANTPFTEAIQNLRTSLLLTNPKTEPCVILMTSSVPGEDKTTTAIALAHSLVGMGKSVLLMEGDLRKNTLSQYFDAVPVKLVEHAGSKTFTESKVTIDDLGFDLMPGMRLETNAADFLSSQDFKDLISEARKGYDHVIISAPPVLPVTDARIIGQQVDAILYAVAWDETRTVIVEAGLREISNSGLDLAGLILTKIDGKKAKSFGGATRYGSYYGEYSKSYS